MYICPAALVFRFFRQEKRKQKEIPVSDNVIDITDKQLAYRTSTYFADAATITVSGAEVVSAAQEGTTVNILLHGATAPDATVTLEMTQTKSSPEWMAEEGLLP